jgi:hypothetical protein
MASKDDVGLNSAATFDVHLPNAFRRYDVKRGQCYRTTGYNGISGFGESWF